ncbi:HAD hydrolase-like protein [Helicobacter saguini]|uniref:phosphoglycolate phosphatase n=1 Tax=Helicobacter saguini TaxID=1548018 RepID=A0A347VRA9_9HELI|nr:HAD family hydrolase [Helicobacter saguini]MWV62970.1 HAD hydrolase-like protein [Helicobacter saguini]MWV66361.1 HAD hydrolase-like protein [Helicobacter saguini]MWV68713.1 HAD hydrolase-like protein [Helicobacter saguini]MWV71736.1 HAD hydrolase-like protein [Helicobacter saguini]TLD92177.1 HAD family hydrolase [Helicobacter saguini]
MDKQIKNIFWDFDGVILDSQKIRIYGFREIFKEYDKRLVDKLIEYHINNGGLSRFNKITYFFNDILGEEISKEKVENYADEFSKIMRKELTNKEYLINDSLTFIQNNYKKYNFHILSGSEENELKFLCDTLEISKYFLSIHGSPTPKVILMQNLLNSQQYNPNECVMIGDSIHDYNAAKANNVDFYGYNNIQLKDVSKVYVVSFY